MSKISLIIQREYFSRVKKKSFIIMTILGPLLMAALFMVPILMAMYEEKEEVTIKVIDESGLFASRFKDTPTLKFQIDTLPLDVAKQLFNSETDDGILYLPGNFINNNASVLLFTAKQANLNMVAALEKTVQAEVEDIKLMAITKEYGMSREELEKTKSEVKINARILTEKGEENSSAELKSIIGFILAFMIYMSIFLYGTQVLRGVMEEKSNRIVEVIISSVKPFQLMLGKIVGIALVGLTQFLLWIVLTFAFSSIATTMFVDSNRIQEQMQQQVTPLGTPVGPGGDAMSQTPQVGDGVSEIFAMMGSVDYGLILGCFIFFFLGGYLLYASLFAAIGSAVDSDSDVQQFMLPVTIPMILSFIVAQNVIQNPDSTLAFWFSIIPLTSPIIMLVRVPFGVAPWELILSMSLLVGGFLLTTFMAGKIYRTGILMYGKKVTWRELGKWLFYK
ncbi:MAG: ABC transporter permease [Bacteroidota bacterium]